MHSNILFTVRDARPDQYDRTYNSFCRALSAALLLPKEAAPRIIPLADELVITYFSGMEELICDLMRNHSSRYRISETEYDGSGEPMAPDQDAYTLTLNDLLYWLTLRADLYGSFTYAFNTKTRHGSYRLSSETPERMSFRMMTLEEII